LGEYNGESDGQLQKSRFGAEQGRLLLLVGFKFFASGFAFVRNFAAAAARQCAAVNEELN
jgi:hypothetical protein